MSQRNENVIVFGPTGAVGSAVAMEALKRGAKVWLGMRDPSKSINKELDAHKENRVQADLTDPASVQKAIQASGATAAFFYLAHQAEDGMKSVIQAMKDAGVTYVVFLSSFTIREGDNIRDITSDRLIPFIHARVEVSLEEVGLAHVALRPGTFATNAVQHTLDKKKTPYEALSLNSDRPNDCVVPSDIGKVGGAVLVDRPSSKEKEVIYVLGAELLTYGSMWKMIKEASDKEINVVEPDSEGKVQWLIDFGTPPPIAKYLIKQENTSGGETYFPAKYFEKGSSSIEKYAGYKPTTFKEFLAKQTL